MSAQVPSPLFSVLIPSRNRAALLRMALLSVLMQDFHDFEIVVADNCSDEDYPAMLATFSDGRIRYVRTDRPLAVAANWQFALAQARGSYVLMLGDDDALLRVSLRSAHMLAMEWRSPDMMYFAACHYAYPGVFADQPDGYFLSVRNSPLFEGDVAYALDAGRGAALARAAFRFRHLISFNAQHFVWRRDLLDRMAAAAEVFADPYPDYFTAVLSFLMAERIIVAPWPLAVIGIAAASFGGHHAAGREAEGLAFLQAGAGVTEPSADDATAQAALTMPGSGHYRNWLLSLLRLRALSPLCGDARIDYRAYRRIQIAHQAADAAANPAARASFLHERVRLMDAADARFARSALRFNLWEKRMGRFDPLHAAARQVVALGVYHHATVRPAASGPCADILAAVAAYGSPALQT